MARGRCASGVVTSTVSGCVEHFASTMHAAIELRGIAKRFPGVVANYDITMTVHAGTIHAIVGENGAGKSTLMKTLYGMHRADEGTMSINGVECVFSSPSQAIAAGIGMVHQHVMLADNLTVAENIVLGAEPMRGVVLDFESARSALRTLGASYGMPIDPDASVDHLGVGERQRVEILKVLYRGARILILDEPTAVLVPQEVRELFVNLRRLKSEGVTVLFISHKLDEVLEIADAITVIRGGTTVASVAPDSVTARELGELMVGSELPSPSTEPSTVTGDVALALDGLTVAGSGRALVDDVSLTVFRGEIVGVAGVEGNGQHELCEAILGLLPATGSVTLAGADVSAMSTKERRHAGLGYVPFDRHREGLLLGSPLWENVVLGRQYRPEFSQRGWMRRGAARQVTEEIKRDFDVRAPDVNTPAFALSGGNQQKLIVGREVTADPAVLIAAHPTRGVDVGAQGAIWDDLREMRRRGAGILLVSADLDELIGLSDRLAVMFEGRLVAWLDPGSVTPDELGLHMAGSAADGRVTAGSAADGPIVGGSAADAAGTAGSAGTAGVTGAA